MNCVCDLNARSRISARPIFVVLCVVLTNICYCQPQQKNWSSFSDGVKKGAVIEVIIKISNGSIFVGGQFSEIDSTSANNIALWDGSNWHALQNGMSKLGVFQIRVLRFNPISNQLYVGGIFSQAGNLTDLGNIAIWDGSNWNSLQNGTNGTISDIVFNQISNQLFVGGSFYQAGNLINVGNVAFWNGSQWNSLQNGTNGFVNALAFDSNSNRLYAGGYFSQAGSTPSTSSIAMWDGSNWYPVGNTSAFELILAVIFDPLSNYLYVGGYFTNIYLTIDSSLKRIPI